MQPVEVKKDIYWVGVCDWNIRDFHGYSTPRGTTYNAYLILDDKVTLVDTVKKPFKADLVHNLLKLTSLEKIDYIIINHVEMDHSGALPDMIDLIKPEKIICSAMAKKALLDHYHQTDWPFEVVSTGQTISLGKRTAQFIETRMLHWPDSMLTYMMEDRLLLSSDAFGQHWATSERFDDETDLPELLAHAAKYYANILLLFSPLVQKLIAEVQKMGIEIDMIAPDHGLIWRTHPGEIIKAYHSWSQQKGKNKALIIYDTMWKSTETMAHAISAGLQREGVEFEMLNLRLNHRSDIMTQVMDAKALILGSPTLNNGMMPTMADILCYMKGLRPANKIGAAFGSYGWSGEAVRLMTEALEEMKVKVVAGGMKIKYTPAREAIEKCVELGREIGRAVKAGS